MTVNRRYKRHFIILDNEDMGFAKDSKNLPKGYVKIEIRNGRGTLGIYLQDLKYFQNGEYIYRNYLIDTKDKTYVDMGSVIINNKGKGEHRRKLNPDNVEGSGKKIEDFNVVAIVAEPLNRPENNKKFCPLVGFINKVNTEWKFILSGKSEDNTEGNLGEEEKAGIIEGIDNLGTEMVVEENKENIEPKTEVEEEVKEEVEDIKEDNEEPEDTLEIEYQEKYKKIMEAIEQGSKELYKEMEEENLCQEDLVENEDIEEVEELIEENEEIKETEEVEENQGLEEEESPLEEDKIQEIEENEEADNIEEEDKGLKDDGKYMDNKKNQREPKNYYNNKYHDMVYKYIKDMLKYREEVKPFENNLENCRWWKMDYSQQNMYRGFLPFFGYILNIYYYNPYIFYMNNCDNLMEKYGHYIFGICWDDNETPKYYIYGVPGRYLYKEQPFRGMTGFVYWHPIEDKEPKRGDYGYWLLHIDAKTGNVVFPYKPTIPPMY